MTDEISYGDTVEVTLPDGRVIQGVTGKPVFVDDPRAEDGWTNGYVVANNEGFGIFSKLDMKLVKKCANPFGDLP